MTGNVGKMRHGKETLHSFVCREREENAPPRHGHGRDQSAREDASSCVE